MENTAYPLQKDAVFSRTPKSEAITYSTFDRSHRHLTAMDASYLYPLLIDEVYPGDVFELTGRHLNRLLASVKPFYDNLYSRFFFFYCPSRLVWKNWKPFMGERRRPDEKMEDLYQVPMLNTGSSGISEGSIFDYGGIPINVPNLEFSALPYRAINLTYNEWFRDENLSDWLNVGGSGSTEAELRETEFGDSDQLSNYKLFRISKKHDYFTGSLPFQQLGAPISVSIGSEAPVYGDGNSLMLTGSIENGTATGRWLSHYASGGLAHTQYLGNKNNLAPGTTASLTYNIPDAGSSAYAGVGVATAADAAGNSVGLVADLTAVTGFSVADFRTLVQLQALKELNARFGHRYKEIVYGEFNVMVSDATLDRPEFLGSYTKYFNVVPVASTAETEDNPQGNLAAFSFTSNSPEFGFVKGFEEHGWLICLAATVTEQSYQQGLNRMYSRKNKYDFYTPLLADISEQAIKMKEILAQGEDVVDANGDPVDEKTFGYQEAWAELRYKPNLITGKMRSTATGTLDVWHLGTKFDPTIIDGENLGVPLNQDFIEDNTRENLQRVLAVDGEPQIESDNYFFMKCTRELPLYSVPAFLTGRL